MKTTLVFVFWLVLLFLTQVESRAQFGSGQKPGSLSL